MPNTGENNRFELFVLRISAGNHPITGKRLPPDSLFLQGEVTDAVRLFLDNIDINPDVSSESIKRNRSRKNMGERWNKEQEAQLASLWAENVQISEIAQIMGRSRGGITSRLNKMGITQSKLNTKFEIYDQGKSDYINEKIRIESTGDQTAEIINSREIRCEECDSIIPNKRLEVVPTTKLCVNCASSQPFQKLRVEEPWGTREAFKKDRQSWAPSKRK